MNEQQPYEKHLAEKLRHLPPPGDKEYSWENMKTILDKEMPRGGGISVYRRYWVFGTVVGVIFVATWLTGKLPSSRSKQMAETVAATKQPDSAFMTGSETASSQSPANARGYTPANTSSQKNRQGILDGTQQADSEQSMAAVDPSLPAAAGSKNANAGSPHPTTTATTPNNSLATTTNADKAATVDANKRNRSLENDAGIKIADLASTRGIKSKEGNTKRSANIKSADEAITTLKNSTAASRKNNTTRNRRIITGRTTGNRSQPLIVKGNNRWNKGLNRDNKPVPSATGNTTLADQNTITTVADNTGNNDGISKEPSADPFTRSNLPGSLAGLFSKPEPQLRPSKVSPPLRYIDGQPRPELIPGPQLQNDYALQSDWMPREVPEHTVAARKKDKVQREQGGLAVGLSLPLTFPLGDQRAMGYNFTGSYNTLTDYIPSPHVQYHFNSNVFVQAELQFFSPQFIRSTLLSKEVDNWGPNYYTSKVVYAKKLYYFNLPVSLHYSPFPGFYFGTGLQYSSLMKGISYTEERRYNTGPGGTNVRLKEGISTFGRKAYAREINANEWRLLFDANYYFERFTVGFRYNQALTNYISFRLSPGVPYSYDKNRALQFYLRYNIFEDRKRNKQPAALLTFK